MRNFWFLIFLFLLFFFYSCSSDGMKEDLSDIPDWDYSNVVADDDTKDNDSVTIDDSTPSDNDFPAIDESSENSDSDIDDAVFHECGNEIVDYNERCDNLAPMMCADLNSNMSEDKIAYCSLDCLSYNLENCEIKNGFWGAVNFHFKTNFILDGAKIGDPTYFQKGALPYSAFNGIYGDIKTLIPVPGQNVSYTETSNYQGSIGGIKRQLFIKQNSVISGSVGYPRFELEFSPGAISDGAEYKINAITVFDQIIDNLLKLVRFRMIEKQNGVECVMGIGYSGSVYITDVFPENADLYDGGSVEVVSNNIDFYYPTEVPGLDENNPEVPAEILKYPVCIK